jgi:para-nitrobenzyl esterase
MTIRSFALAVAAVGALAAVQPSLAMAQAAAPAAAAAGFSVEKSTIGELLASPAAKAVLEKHIPEIVGNAQIAQAATMTLKGIQQYAPDLTDEKLAKIDTDLKAVK